MAGDVKFGCRIARVTSTRDASGHVRGFREDGRPLDRELVLCPYERVDWGAVKETALSAERLGYDSLIVPDHLMTGLETFESWTTLAALGAVTSRIRLGELVLCYAYRGLPTIFAKQVVTLDHISGGRLDLGLGAGYERLEFRSYGVPWRPARERIAQLEEFLEILKLMWTEEEVSYEGRYFKVREAVCEPKPVQKPHPPITVGGKGRLILKVSAKHADWINVASNDPVEIEKTMETLKAHCKSVGRDPSEIGKSWGEWVALFEDEKDLSEHGEIIKSSPNTWCGTPEQYIDRIKNFVDLGITYITPRFVDLPCKKSMTLFAERVIPEFKC